MRPGIRFEVPLRLGRGQNERGGWRSRHGRNQRERDAIFYAAASVVTVEGCARARLGEVLKAMACKPVEVCLVRLHTRHSKGLDRDNLVASFKSVRDALTEVMGLKSDRESAMLAWTYAQEEAWTWGLRVEVGPLSPPVKLPEWTAEEWREIEKALRAELRYGSDEEPDRARRLEKLADKARAVGRALEGSA